MITPLEEDNIARITCLWEERTVKLEKSFIVVNILRIKKNQT